MATVYCNFAAECVSERILKIDLYFVKLWRCETDGFLFIDHRVDALYLVGTSCASLWISTNMNPVDGLLANNGVSVDRAYQQ